MAGLAYDNGPQLAPRLQEHRNPSYRIHRAHNIYRLLEQHSTDRYSNLGPQLAQHLYVQIKQYHRFHLDQRGQRQKPLSRCYHSGGKFQFHAKKDILRPKLQDQGCYHYLQLERIPTWP